MSGNQNRIISIDTLRGIVISLMTLDHTRDFFSNAHFDPTDLGQTTPTLFLTRWITHFCAPVFIFLAGVSVLLAVRRQGDVAPVRRFLALRGLFIMFIGLTLESLIWTPRPDFSVISGSVLWAIGWSMLALALLLPLSANAITLFGLVVITVHNAFDSIPATQLGTFAPIWSILHSGELVRITSHLTLEPYYPLIPWIGVIAVGYGSGRLFLCDRHQRQTQFLWIGTLLTLMFLLFRWINDYGDPKPWATQATWSYTVLSFINCHKYPPSLLYLLMTLGPSLMLLSLLERLPERLTQILCVFGKTPLFFYVLHLPLILALALVVDAWQTGTVPNFLEQPFRAENYGYSLWIVYGLWVAVLLMLYPVCRWYAALKRKYPDWSWLQYL